MQLLPAQLATLKAAIAAEPTPVTYNGAAVAVNLVPNTPDGAVAIAAFYNALDAGPFIVWRTNVPTAEIRAVLDWSAYILLAVSNQNAFEFLVSGGLVDASRSNVRAGIAAIFGSPSTNLTALQALAKRSATRAEKLFAAGTGSDVSPATMVVEGALLYTDVLAARAL
jgi:hypothetical protein